MPPPPAVAGAVADAPVGPTSLKPVESEFVLGAIENGRELAELARLGASQARSSALREFAQQLVSDLGPLNVSAEMLARRKALPVPLQPASFTDEYRDLAARSGDDFDRSLTSAIASASRRALRLAEAAVSTARDTDVRGFAGSMLPVVRDHANKSAQLEKAL